MVHLIRSSNVVLSPCDEYRYASETERLDLGRPPSPRGAGLEQPAYRDFLPPGFVGRVCGVLSSPTRGL